MVQFPVGRPDTNGHDCNFLRSFFNRTHFVFRTTPIKCLVPPRPARGDRIARKLGNQQVKRARIAYGLEGRLVRFVPSLMHKLSYGLYENARKTLVLREADGKLERCWIENT